MVAINQYAPPKPAGVTYSSTVAAVFRSMRYLLTPMAYLIVVFCLLAGGYWLWAPMLIALALGTVVEEAIGDDLTEPANPPTWLFTALYYLIAPLLLAALTLLLHYFTLGDPLGLVALLARAGVDFDAARKATTPFDLAAIMMAQGLYFSFSLGAVHELSHQTTSRTGVLLSQVIGAFSFEAWMPIHHPHCHHMLVGYAEDTATPQRGESLYRFVPRAFLGAVKFSGDWERKALARRGVPWWSPRNRYLRGWLFVGALALYAFSIAGVVGALVYVTVALSSRAFLESVDYAQHYGLVRAPGEPISERFTWDVYRVVTNAILFNAGRHADHHAYATRHGGLLRLSDAPYMPKGYVTLILIALIPPLHRRFMAPYLANWDLHYATPAELAFMREQGIPHIEGQACALA